ncbi:siroheme synthase CysG [Pseudooceanicola sp. C21-150M6]|uniref:siroheme synthase CysG n=1 Tax=Pseudooceanicola sp. C21-150M6 TaxID=3434355 RepID=UPI003D7FA27D
MKNFPMFLRMDGRRVVLCGGGEEIARKARLVLKTEARLTIVGPVQDAELSALIDSGRADHHTALQDDTFLNTALVFIATGSDDDDLRMATAARAAGAVVNVIDRPDMCDAFTPSIVDRDPVVVAIGTEGTAPVLGRAIKTEIETMLAPRLGSFAALAGRLRDAVAEAFPPAARRRFWEWSFSGEAWRAHLAGRERQAAQLLKTAIEQRAIPDAKGSIALVGAGPGARDLLTLRAVQRMQEADVIFYDRLVDPDVLELARRDADRIYVGKEVGASVWPQDRIDRLIVAEAQKGRRVVRLKSGDPSVFGRASEELAAARAHGINIEIVPGITAASAAAASLGRPLTERGETDSFVLTTGTCRPGDHAPDRSMLARPGMSVAVYMAVNNAAQVQADMVAAGMPVSCPVDIVASVSTDSERHVSTTLGHLADAVRTHDIRNPALLMLRYPKSLARPVAQTG